MSTLTLDDLPSTLDCPVEEGGDPVLQTLVNARERFARGHTIYRYSSGGQVCAIGAALMEDDIARPYVDGERRLSVVKKVLSERMMQNSTREAIRLLESEARRRHPIRSLFPTKWTGHLERINQEEEHSHVAILSIYDSAIERRRAQTV